MTEKLEAPTLPKGYRFKVKTDTLPGEVQAAVLKLMQSQTRWLAFDTKAVKEVLDRRGKFNDEASKVMGCYPPKRFLGEDR